jgi:hypothetical protein
LGLIKLRPITNRYPAIMYYHDVGAPANPCILAVATAHESSRVVPLTASRKIHPVSRSLLILVVTAIVVAGAYYGFSRFGSTSGPTINGTIPSQASNATPTGAAEIEDTLHARSSPEHNAVQSQAAADAPAPDTATSLPVPAVFTIAINKAHPPTPSDVIRAKEGDRITLSITTDRAGTLEVHGYREEVRLEPDTTGTLSFVASKTGRFPIDLHARDGAHVEVTALEVLPR